MRRTAASAEAAILVVCALLGSVWARDALPTPPPPHDTARFFLHDGSKHSIRVVDTPSAAGVSFSDGSETGVSIDPAGVGAGARQAPSWAPRAQPPASSWTPKTSSSQWNHRGPEGRPALGLVPAPWDPTILYALADGLHRIQLQPDGSFVWYETGLSDRAILRIGLDPWHPNTLFASEDNVGLYKSTDGGETWSIVGVGLPAPSRTRKIVFHPTIASVLYVVDASRSVYVSTNEGSSFSPRNTGLPPPFFPDDYSDLVIDPSNPSTMYVSSNWNGVYKTTDAGATWTESNTGLPRFDELNIAGFVRSLAIDPVTPTRLYAGVTAGSPGGSAYRSLNGGATWSRMVGVPRQNAHRLAVDPTNPQVVYVGLIQNAFNPSESGVFKSTDGGTTWAPTAFCNGAITHIALDGSVSPTVVCVAEGVDAGVLRSVDGGANFEELIPGTLRAVMLAVGASPSDPGVAYAGGWAHLAKTTDGGATWVETAFCDVRSTSIVVHPTDPSTVYAAIETGVVYRTIDGGNTWTAATQGITTSGVYRLAFDPVTPTTLYAAALTDLYKTTDAGASWVSSSAGIEALFILDVAVAPSNPLTLYATTVNGGVYKSITGGLAWFPANAGLPLPTELTDVYTDAIAVHPTNPDIAYVRSSDEGTFKTTTGGAAWFKVDTNPSAFQIVIDPVAPERVFAVGPNFGVRVSTNDGATWQFMNDGLQTTEVRGFAIGSDGQMLLAATVRSMARWEPTAVAVDPVPEDVASRPRARFTTIVPSPATGREVMFGFELDTRARVGFEIVDVRSRRVALLPARSYEPGRAFVRWNERNEAGSTGLGAIVPSGVYFVRMLVDGHPVAIRKLVKVR